MSTEIPGSSQQAPITPAPPTAAGSPSQEEWTQGMLCHILAFCGLVFPFGNILGPLIIWMMKKDQSEFVNDQGKESVNFQISLAIVGVGLAIASMVLGVIPVLGYLVSLLLGLVGFAAGIYAVVLVITGAMKAKEGIAYRYPYNLRLIK